MTTGHKRVLVTGATGFVGRHAIRALVGRGYEVHAVARSAHLLRSTAGIVAHSCDLLDAADLQQAVRQIAATHLLHLAWYTEPGKYWNSPENLRWVQASLQLIDSFFSAGGKRAVFAGTCAEYDWSHHRYMEELTPTRPHSLYGACKLGLSQIVERFGEAAGISTAWGRLFFLYGPHEREGRFVSDIAGRLSVGLRARCEFGDHVRDFLHVADAGDAFAQLLDGDVTGAVNIASGRPVSLGTIARMIATLIGRPDLLDVGDRPPHDGNPAELLACTQRLNQEVGWQPAINLETGLEDVVRCIDVESRAA